MKKKVWFLLSHLKAGGAERVFWILSQYLDKTKFEVSLVLLDSTEPFFSTDISDINFIHLNTKKASRSFLGLCKLIKREKPYAIFSNGSHLNILMAAVSVFSPVNILIGREVNVPELMANINGPKAMFWDKFTSLAYKKIHIGICQSEEIRRSLISRYNVPAQKLTIIPNPVIETKLSKVTRNDHRKHLIVVARLAKEKGLFRLLEIVEGLPDNYYLSIAGDGPLRSELIARTTELKLDKRVSFLGNVKNIQELIAKHDLMVLSSFTEGFPNVVLESLSVGVPVVSFEVSGINALIANDFNGFVIEQNNLTKFRQKIFISCEREWDTQAIKDDVQAKFGIQKIVRMYEGLLSQSEMTPKEEPAVTN